MSIVFMWTAPGPETDQVRTRAYEEQNWRRGGVHLPFQRPCSQSAQTGLEAIWCMGTNRKASRRFKGEALMILFSSACWRQHWCCTSARWQSPRRVPKWAHGHCEVIRIPELDPLQTCVQCEFYWLGMWTCRLTLAPSCPTRVADPESAVAIELDASEDYRIRRRTSSEQTCEENLHSPGGHGHFLLVVMCCGLSARH